MTRKERMLAAMRREAVDRCPHTTYNIHPFVHSVHVGDASYSEMLEQIRATSGVAVKGQAMGTSVGLSCPLEGQVESRTEANGNERITTTTVHTPKGDLTSIYTSYVGKPGMTTKHLVESDEDIEKYLSLPYEPPVWDMSVIRELYNAVGDTGVILVGFPDPMYEAASLFHYEDFCIRTLTDLDSIKRMVDWTFERSLDNVRLLVEACGNMDVILHTSGPELCTPPMIPPSVFAQLVTPYMKRIIEVIHKGGKLACIHCHGRVRDVFEDMIETGADVLEPIEPTPQGDIDLEELMEKADGRICLMGHVQDQEFYTAPEGHMTHWVEHVTKVVNGRTGYIMSPTCTPFDLPCTDTYSRNYLEWLRAADRLL